MDKPTKVEVSLKLRIPLILEAWAPADATIQFNLACCEAQMGNLTQAKVHLERATRIDQKFRLMALEDRDLEPLWGSLAAD